MPLVAYALAAYIGGLFAGFSDSLIGIALATAAAVVAGWSRGRIVGVAFAALCVTGIVAARSAQRETVRCAQEAPLRPPLLAIVEDSASPGAYVRARLAACDGNVSIA